METWVIIGLIALVVIYRIGKKGNKAAINAKGLHRADTSTADRAAEEAVAIEIEIVPPRRDVERQVVEIVTANGEPAFKYRFHATLDFNTPSDVLKRHRAEEFIERPGGNRGPIQEDYGWWSPISEFDRPEWAYGAEDDKFKYIGGYMPYIKFLLAVRSVYEARSRTPQSKRDGIRKVCDDSRREYALMNSYRPPWESLIVPVLSLADGFGPHRVGLLEDAGIRSIHDVESRSDKELLTVKGVGKAAVATLRVLCATWQYDKFTDCIERDEPYRAVE